MEIVNKKEIPFELSAMLYLPSMQSEDTYFFDRDGLEKLQNLREAIMDCIDDLSDKDRFIIEAVNYEKITYEQLGERLGCSNVHAWRQAKTAMNNLRQLLLKTPEVQEYLGVGDD